MIKTKTHRKDKVQLAPYPPFPPKKTEEVLPSLTVLVKWPVAEKKKRYFLNFFKAKMRGSSLLGSLLVVLATCHAHANTNKTDTSASEVKKNKTEAKRQNIGKSKRKTRAHI